MKIEEIYSQLPTLETKRLVLRKLSLADAEDMHAYASDEQVARYVTWNRHADIEETRQFIDFVLSQYDHQRVAPWGIACKETNQLIGTIDFVWWKPEHKLAEIGYALSCEQWGKGIMTEATRAVIEFGFTQMELVRIQARCLTANAASAKVMEKIGMTFEGTMRKGIFVKGNHADVHLYALLREDFEEGRKLEKTATPEI